MSERRDLDRLADMRDALTDIKTFTADDKAAFEGDRIAQQSPYFLGNSYPRGLRLRLNQRQLRSSRSLMVPVGLTWGIDDGAGNVVGDGGTVSRSVGVGVLGLFIAVIMITGQDSPMARTESVRPTARMLIAVCRARSFARSRRALPENALPRSDKSCSRAASVGSLP